MSLFSMSLTNPSFPDYVKIGYAKDLEKRMNQLNRSETIPFAFRAYAIYEVDSNLTDVVLHDLIDRLNPDLHSIENFDGKERKREFYAMRVFVRDYPTSKRRCLPCRFSDRRNSRG